MKKIFFIFFIFLPVAIGKASNAKPLIELAGLTSQKEYYWVQDFVFRKISKDELKSKLYHRVHPLEKKNSAIPPNFWPFFLDTDLYTKKDERSCIEKIQALNEIGFDLSLELNQTYLPPKDRKGTLVEQIILSQNHPLNCIRALGQVSEINWQGPKENPTRLLTLAIQKSDPKLVRFLLKKGSPVNHLTAENNEPLSPPLKAAAFLGNRPMVQLLLKNGAQYRKGSFTETYLLRANLHPSTH